MVSERGCGSDEEGWWVRAEGLLTSWQSDRERRVSRTGSGRKTGATWLIEFIVVKPVSSGRTSSILKAFSFLPPSAKNKLVHPVFIVCFCASTYIFCSCFLRRALPLFSFFVQWEATRLQQRPGYYIICMVSGCRLILEFFVCLGWHYVLYFPCLLLVGVLGFTYLSSILRTTTTALTLLTALRTSRTPLSYGEFEHNN